MEAGQEQEDPFAFILELCQPTPSQETELMNCPLTRESENFFDSNPDQFTASQPTEIVMVSPPDSVDSVHHQQELEDDAVFHTPPEHPVNSHHSSSEDQNLDELYAEVSGRLKKVRVFQKGSDDDEPKSKRFQDCNDGETVPVGETEAIGVEIEGNEGVHRDTEVISVDSADCTVNLADDLVVVISKGGGVEVSTTDVVRKFGALMKKDENHELGRKSDIGGNSKGENPYENSDLTGSLDSGKIEEEIVKLKRIAGNRCIEKRHESGGETDWKRIEEIDKFRYVGEADDVDRSSKGRSSRTRRQLPSTLKGEEKNVRDGRVAETLETTKIGLMGFLDVLKVVRGDVDGGGCTDVNFLETAKRRGTTLPQARWWPSP